MTTIMLSISVNKKRKTPFNLGSLLVGTNVYVPTGAYTQVPIGHKKLSLKFNAYDVSSVID